MAIEHVSPNPSVEQTALLWDGYEQGQSVATLARWLAATRTTGASNTPAAIHSSRHRRRLLQGWAVDPYVASVPTVRRQVHEPELHADRPVERDHERGVRA